MIVRPALCALAVAWIGCPAPDPELEATGTPAVFAAVLNGAGAPDAIDFGDLDVGGDAFVDIRILNDGTGPLRNLMVDLAADLPISMTPLPAPRFLDAGEEVTLQLHLQPAEDLSVDSVLRVTSNDPDTPALEIPVRGQARGPRATLRSVGEPPEVEVGCTATLQMVVANDGRGGVVEVEDVTIVGVDRALFTSLRPDEAWSLAPGDERAFGVRYRPDEAGLHEAMVRLEGAEPTAEGVVSGEASLGADRSDTFIQSQGAAADLLFVVDNSPGMDHAALLDAAADLVAALDSWGLDWHVGVVTTDVGELGHLRGRPAWTNGSLADSVTPLQDVFDVGNGGTELEQGMHNAFMALSAPAVTGVNAGFLRNEALLHLVFVSDEDDLSEPASGWSALEYAAFFEDRKEFPMNVVASDITGGRSGCDGVRAADATDRFTDLTAALGGHSGSYCEASWGPAMAAVAALSRRRALGFEPTLDPVESTLSVTVDGTPTTAWTWQDDAVVFDPAAAPLPGAVVQLSYVAQSCSEGEPAP